MVLNYRNAEFVWILVSNDLVAIIITATIASIKCLIADRAD